MLFQAVTLAMILQINLGKMFLTLRVNDTRCGVNVFHVKAKSCGSQGEIFQ